MPSTAVVRCGKYLLAVIAFWTGYCALMAAWPQLFDIPLLRALVRVSVVLVPAVLYYLRGPRQESFVDYFQLRPHWRKGLLVGGGVVLAYLLLGWLSGYRTNQSTFQIPQSFAVWFNFILGSPIAEETFFRGVLLKELSPLMGTARSIAVSSLAFALRHLPQWVILSHQSGLALLTSFATIFAYGVVFALLVTTTRSLWASLLPHWVNNFVALSLGQ
ncbi:MAG: CPBP family intramembrane glutamic endopeptidase [Caldilineaceae bacterium]